MTEILGYTAAALTTAAFVPQAVLVYKTRNTESISLLMFLIFNLGLVCWGIYGIILNQLPIILANSITFLLALYILFMKIKGLIKNQKAEIN
jgi:MtN3 and saliva related transmembrane protein